MAHVRKDTLAKPPSFAAWWKHLKEYKRTAAKSERRAAKKEILREISE
jgi:hypothetical protein